MTSVLETGIIFHIGVAGVFITPIKNLLLTLTKGFRSII